jgi:hypothetical protein
MKSFITYTRENRSGKPFMNPIMTRMKRGYRMPVNIA